MRARFKAIRWSEKIENSAPEGRTNLAQRFKRWEEWEKDPSPGGTASSHTDSKGLGAVCPAKTLMSSESTSPETTARGNLE